MRNSALSVLLLFASAALAQTQASKPPPAAQAPLVSPQIFPDHRVTFRLRAPKASEVTIAGDFWLQQNRADKLVKDDQGVWSLTTEPLTPDYYSYFFTVDGVRIPDPANGLIKPGVGVTQSAFSIPGPQAALLEAGAVPHGDVRIVYYPSATLGKPRRMHIYFPPGYEEGQTRYPVLYLFHGGGDDDSGWNSVGRVNFILDNLIAQGKAKPMIVVMPSIWALDPPVRADLADENEALFQKTFFQEIVPYAEKHYRVLPGPANRAVGGLGGGRDWLPNFVWPNLDKFNYVVFVSGGADVDRFAFLQKQHPGVIDDPANIKRVKFFLGDGIDDASFPSAKNLAEELKRRGYTTTFFQSENTHGWPEFRLNFVQFAQIAFR
jgi:enterochelin esterase-like enzyme